MPPALCVAADVGRSPSTSQSPAPTQLSPSATRRNFRTRRRARTAHSESSQPQLASPHLPAWLPSQHGASSQYGVPSSPLQPNNVIRIQPSTFSLRDQAVEKFEAGLQKQGSLSSTGKMTPPVHAGMILSRAPVQQSSMEQRGPPSGAHDRFTPTPNTPAFYPSPTSPSTPTIPPTPPMSQESWHQSPPSKYPYPSYTGDRNIYSSQAHNPYLRQRSVTSPSIPPHSPVRLSPVALPIGKKVPKWREAYSDVAQSQVYTTTSYTLSTKIPFSRSPSPGPPRYRRISTPMGPRPMGSHAYSNGLGIGMPKTADTSGEDFAPSSYLHYIAMHRQHSQTGSDWQGTVRSSLDPDGADGDYSRADELSLAGRSRRGASDESDGVLGSVWEGDGEGRGYESGCEEDGGEDVECRSSSEDGSHGAPEPRALFIPSAPWPDPHAADLAAPPLDEPFELHQPSSVESGERSAFDSDTEDEDESAPLGRRFSTLRKALLKSSMSVPSLKARLSVFSTTASSSLDTSPESVASLRARQVTNSSSPGRNPYVLKIATDMVLDPIPPSPADVESPELPAGANATHSPATPATPASPQVRQTKSFIFEVNKTPLFLETPPPLPGSSSHGPPNLPLPVPPLSLMSLSTPSLPLRPRISHTGRRGSFVEKWRMDVEGGGDRLTMVDPNMSMARLEESLMKLESHAPRTSSETDPSSPPAPPETLHEIRPSMDSASVYSTGKTGEGECGVVVLSVEPTRLEVSPPQTPSFSLRKQPPPTPPKDRSIAPVQTTPRRGQPRRQPSLALLPLFDFETRRDQQSLDLHVPPLRSSSLISPRASDESPDHPRSLSADAQSSISQAQSMPVPSKLGSPVRRRPTLDDGTPRETYYSVETAPPGVASFMNFSPPQKPASRMRRLWNRVDPRVAGVAKGLRGSLLP